MGAVVLWAIVGLYVLISFYALAGATANRHVYTRSVGARVRIVLEAAGWPLVLAPWRELPSWLRTQWHALTPRYQALP
jgi:hypothetical protein